MVDQLNQVGLSQHLGNHQERHRNFVDVIRELPRDFLWEQRRRFHILADRLTDLRRYVAGQHLDYFEGQLPLRFGERAVLQQPAHQGGGTRSGVGGGLSQQVLDLDAIEPWQ